MAVSLWLTVKAESLISSGGYAAPEAKPPEFEKGFAPVSQRLTAMSCAKGAHVKKPFTPN
jgi:hypothetical protein